MFHIADQSRDSGENITMYLSFLSVLGRYLEELFINDNRITELHAIPLQMPALQIVDVSNNHVEDFQQMVSRFCDFWHYNFQYGHLEAYGMSYP